MLREAKTFSSFSVKDLSTAKTFYSETLGLNVAQRPEGLEITTGSGAIIFLYPKPDHTPASFTVLNFAVSNVEATVDELVQRGVRFEKYDDGEMKTDAKGIARGERGPKAIAWFRDPDGNFLSVVEPRE
jgi:catechol 2,3-dioxygenase-like lactoylglutathione lyase family enzyme